MSELQSEEAVIDSEVETVETAEPVEASESASDSEDQHEQKVDDSNINQEAINKRIGELTFERREAERQAEEYKRKLAAYEEQQNQAPVIPPEPDEFSSREEVQAYADAVKNRAIWEERQKLKTEQQQKIQQESQLARQAEVQSKAQAYLSKAEESGISQEEITNSMATIGNLGIGLDIQEYLLEQDPLVTKYLAANPSEGIAVAGMNPMQAAVYISTSLSEKAKSLKPKTTSAPAPTTKVDGGGADPDLGAYKHIKGGAFE